MTHLIKRMLCVILSMCMMVTLFAGFGSTAYAADGVTVTIESFLRGPQEDLRSSELLVANVQGYDGNVHDLTYEWTSTLGTYLYVYNSHNMYSINNTDGEIEIYNSDKRINSSANMSGRSYNKKFSGKGFMYAAVYGASINSNSSLVGVVTVTVKDPSGKVLATDSHEGTVTESGMLFWKQYTYHGFIEASLQVDLDMVTFGIFEGDKRNVKDLLGESAILHITCGECTVTEGAIVSGGDYISLTGGNTISGNLKEDYYITGTKPGSKTSGGDAKVSLSVEKGNCKFHYETEGSATTTVYVYRRPIPVPTTTSITLAKESLDSRCRYYINGVEATVQDDGTYIWTGLTPNTDYEIEAVGQVAETEPAYAYVYTRTMPVYNAGVEVYLNGTYDSTTGTVTSGQKVDLTDVGYNDNDLYIKKIDSNVFVELVYTGTGSYSVGVENGVYKIYHENNDASEVAEQEITIESTNRTRYLFYNSVEYDANGGTGAPETEYYYSTSAAYVNNVAPAREGYIFKGWQDTDGKIYQPGELITDSISKAHKLTAIWEDAVDVFVHIQLKHNSNDGSGYNIRDDRHNILFTVDGRIGDSGDYVELVQKSIEWNGLDTFNYLGYQARIQRAGDTTIYYANEPTFKNMPGDMKYTFTTAKTGYTVESITTTRRENNDADIEAVLVFDPNDFDFTFNVELDEEAKKLPDEFKPVAVNTKVTCWYDCEKDDEAIVDWHDIVQHHETVVRTVLDENGQATGTFPVWMVATDMTPYYYRIEVVSYELADGTTMPAIDVDGKHETYKTADDRYSAKVEVVGGMDPDPTDSSALTGIYYADEKQNGTVTAIVSIEVFDVTFDPNGGQFADGTTAPKTVAKQVMVPSFENYVPTREGGYTFAGWYLADANGNITETTMAEGEVLFFDVTLKAKWNDPLTVKGTVSVDATYEGDQGTEHDICENKVESVMVLLQEVDKNGYAHTLDSKRIDITYDGHFGTGEYEFAGLANDGSTYRIKAMEANYGEKYQNATSSSQVVTNYESYDATHYLAVFGDESTATVNAYMPFTPELFDLKFEIDATAIGEGFRPYEVETLILYDDQTGIVNHQERPVINRMVTADGYNPKVTAMNPSGLGQDSYTVMEYNHNHVDFYEYSMRLATVGTMEVNAEAPFLVTYNGVARYSAVNGQTNILKAHVVPKRYTIHYDLGVNESVEIKNMDEYVSIHGTCEQMYYWSYGTLIEASPERDGYTFLGWYDDNGNRVYDIPADMHENITLHAKWMITTAFKTMCDAGYYAEERKSEDKTGVISLNAFITNFADVKNSIVSFGIYVYNPTGDVIKATAESTDVDVLTADEGYFHTVVSDIAKENFDKKVVGMPFVIFDLDGNSETTDDREIFVGDVMTVSVSEINKWLGQTNPYV